MVSLELIDNPGPRIMFPCICLPGRFQDTGLINANPHSKTGKVSEEPVTPRFPSFSQIRNWRTEAGKGQVKTTNKTREMNSTLNYTMEIFIPFLQNLNCSTEI